MEFSIVAALVAGFAATAVMATMMRMASRAGVTDMPPMELVVGSMMTGDVDRAKRVGFGLHWVMMGTMLFGLAYAGLFTALDSSTWLTGLGVGAVHGVLVGGMFLPMMPSMHPRMTSERFLDGPVAVTNGTVSISSPGLFGSRWGGMTPVGLVMGHAVYGVVAALVYSQIV